MKKKVFSLMMTLLLAFMGVAKADVVTIGDPTSTTTNSYLPGYSLYEYSISQQIYTADEIGTGGTINTLTMWLKNSSSYARNLNVYMKEVNNATFASNSDWVSMTASDMVASFTMANGISSPVETAITLTTPFAYSGNGNLVICVQDVTGSWSSGLGGVQMDAEGNQAIYAYRDGTVYDPTTPGVNGYLGTKKNVVALDITPGGESAAVMTADFESNSIPEGWASESTATAQWTIGVGDACTSPVLTPYVGNYNARCLHSSRGNDVYLVSSMLDLSAYEYGVTVSCWYTNREWTPDVDGFGIYYRETADGEWVELFYTEEAHSTWTQAEVRIPEGIEECQLGFLMHDGWGYGVALDNIELFPNPAPEPITEVNILFDELAYGEEPAAPTAEDDTYTVESYTWTHDGEDVVPLETVDNSGSYNVTVVVAPADGYYFDDEAVYTLNGVEAEVVEVIEGVATITLPATAVLEPNKPIAEVYIEGFTEPVWGNTFDNEVNVPEGEDYTLVLAGWYHYAPSRNETIEDARLVQPEEIYNLADEVYVMQFILSPNERCEFTDPYTAYLDGSNEFVGEEGFFLTNAWVRTIEFALYEEGLHTLSTYTYGQGLEIPFGETEVESLDRLIIERPNGAWMEPYHFNLYNDGEEDVEVVYIDFLHDNGYFSMVDAETLYPFTVEANGRPGVDLYINTEETWGSIAQFNSLLAVNTTERSTHLYQILAAPYTPYCPDVVEKAYPVNLVAGEDWSMMTSEMWNAINPNAAYELHNNYDLPFNDIPEGYDAVMKLTFDHAVMLHARVDDAYQNGKVALYRQIGEEPVHPMADNNYYVRPMHNEGSAPAGGTAINFNGGDFSQFSNYNNDATYPWTVVSDGRGYYMKSGNGGVSSSTSAFSTTVNYAAPGMVSFDFQAMGEGTSTAWDKCIFEIDGTQMFAYGAHGEAWDHYDATVTAGSHVFTWKYTKDSSVNPTGDYFAVDNIAFGGGRVVEGNRDITLVQDFEDGMGDWTMSNCHNSTGVSTSYTAHDGNGTFRFYYSSNYPQYLISPMLSDNNGGTMSFFYARYSSYYEETFQVGYSTTTNDPTAFSWGNEVTCTNYYNDEYLEYTYDFPAGTKYVSIACTSDDQFYLFIDDITINMIEGGQGGGEEEEEEGVAGAVIEDLTVVAGTYYLVASSTDPDFLVVIGYDELPCPIAAVTNIEPWDNQPDVVKEGLKLKFDLDPYAEEWRVVFSSTYYIDDLEEWVGQSIDPDQPYPYYFATPWSSEINPDTHPYVNYVGNNRVEVTVSGGFMPAEYPLYDNTNYFWRVEQRSNYGNDYVCVTEGPVFGFTTCLDIPLNLTANYQRVFEGLTNGTIEDADGQNITVRLSWDAIQDRTHRIYRVYKMNDEPSGEDEEGNPIYDYTMVQDEVTNTYWDIPAAQLTYNLDGEGQYTLGHGHVYRVAAVYDEGESRMSNPAEISVSGYGTISGTAYEQDGTTPIAGVNVTISGFNEFGTPDTYEAITNANGQYQVDAHAGSYTVAYATKDGYAYEGNPNVTHVPTVHELPFAVLYHQNTPNVDFIMDEAFYAPVNVCAQTVYVPGVQGDSLVQIYWDFNTCEPFDAQIGTGTSTTGYFPFYTLYNNSVAMALYKAEELSAAGVTTSAMSSLSWYATNSIDEAQLGLTIWMANVTDATVPTTTPLAAGMTKVYTGMLPANSPIGWTEFVFNEESFAWDGSSNVLILVQRNCGDWTTSISWQASSVGFNAASYRYSDSESYNVEAQTYSMTSSITSRPNTIFSASCSGGREIEATRSLHHFNIYRTSCYNPGPYNSDNTELLATAWVPDTSYFDVSWPAAEPGVYKFGVSAVYEGNRTVDYPYEERESEITWQSCPTECIDKEMWFNDVTVNVLLNSADNAYGATVTFVNNNPYEEALYPMGAIVIDSTQYYEFPTFRRGEYTVTVERVGYVTEVHQIDLLHANVHRDVYDEHDMYGNFLYHVDETYANHDLRFVLTEIIYGVQNIYVSRTGWAMWDPITPEGGAPVGPVGPVGPGGAGELTIHDGTVENHRVPAYVSYFDDYTRSQHVIPAADLAAMNGSYIQSVKWYTRANYNLPYTTLCDVDLYVKEVADATISQFVNKADCQIVYTGTLSFEPNADGIGECVVTFTTPYHYNGGNLLIGCENLSDPGYKFMYFQGETVTGASVAGYNSSATGTINPSQQDFLPKTTFTYGGSRNGGDRHLEGYKVMCTSIDGEQIFNHNTIVPEPWCQLSTRDLVEGGHYLVKICTIYSTGESPWSAPVEWVYEPCDHWGPVDEVTASTRTQGNHIEWVFEHGFNPYSILLDPEYDGSVPRSEDALDLSQYLNEPVYRQYSDEGLVLNFLPIDNVYFRLYLLYSLYKDNSFVVTADNQYGQFIVNPAIEMNNFMEEFESFYQRAEMEFSLMDKPEITQLSNVWKDGISSVDYLSIMMDVYSINSRADNDHCISSIPFCTTDVIEFPAAHSGGATADEDAEFGCVTSQPYPSWYHMQIRTPGQFVIHMEATSPTNPSNHPDIDFCLWGPFTDPTAACNGGLTCEKIIDCSFSTAGVEDAYLGYPVSEHNHTNLADGTCINYHVPEAGEWYILMITNYSQQECNISFTKTEGEGETDCFSDALGFLVTIDGEYLDFIWDPEAREYDHIGEYGAHEYCIRPIYPGRYQLPEHNYYFSMGCPVCSFTTGDEPTCDAGAPISGENYGDDQVLITWGEEQPIEPQGETFFFDFETDLQGWTNVIEAGDGYGWMHISDLYTGTEGYGHNGSDGWAIAVSYINNVGAFNDDSYLISPQMYAIGDGATLSFAQDFMDDNYQDYMEVCVATAEMPTANDFTAIWNNGGSRNGNAGVRAGELNRLDNWSEFTLDLSAYAGQNIWIAFHHQAYNQFIVFVDDVTITTAGRNRDDLAIVSYNIYRSDDNITYALIGNVQVNEENWYQYFDAPGVGTYYYKVTAVYSDGCESEGAVDAANPENHFVVVIVTGEGGSTGVDELSAKVALFPNPTKGNVTIQAQGMNRITVVSVLGQVVYDTELDQDEFTLNMAQFNNGMYMVRVYTNEGVAVKRVTVMH